MHLRSNYWNINSNDSEPDVAHGEDSDADYFIPSSTSLSKCGSTIAVGGNTSRENLKVYDLKESTLIHLTSITLPDIQSLKFLTPTVNEEFKFLATGHSDGIVNLTTIPLSEDGPFQNAEIIKRFNHQKHLPTSQVSMLNNGGLSSTIQSIGLTPSEWTSTPLNSLMTVYNNNVFLWDSCRSRAPKSIISTPGVTNLSPNPQMDGVIGIVGEFGLSLLDTKAENLTMEYKRNKRSSLYVTNTQYAATAPLKVNRQFSFPKVKPIGSTHISWHKDGNYVSTSTISNLGDIVQIWDVRKLEPLAILEGLHDEVIDMKWVDDTLWTGDKDGCITKWGLKSVIESPSNETSKPKRLTKNSESFKVTSSSIVSLELVDDGVNNEGIICLDSKFLSLHTNVEDLQLASNHSANSLFSGTSNSPLGSPAETMSDTDVFEQNNFASKLQNDIDLMLSNLNYIVKDNTIYL